MLLSQALPTRQKTLFSVKNGNLMWECHYNIIIIRLLEKLLLLLQKLTSLGPCVVSVSSTILLKNLKRKKSRKRGTKMALFGMAWLLKMRSEIIRSGDGNRVSDYF